MVSIGGILSFCIVNQSGSRGVSTSPPILILYSLSTFHALVVVMPDLFHFCYEVGSVKNDLRCISSREDEFAVRASGGEDALCILLGRKVIPISHVVFV